MPIYRNSFLLALCAFFVFASVSARADFLGRAHIVEAVRTNDVDRIKQEFLNGASVNATMEDGTPILLLAVSLQNFEAAEFLLANGARPDDRDRAGHTPLTLAAQLADFRMVKLLLDSGANVDRDGELHEPPLIKAVQVKAADIVELLVKGGADINATDGTGRTALEIAQANRDSRIEKLLTGAGAH